MSDHHTEPTAPWIWRKRNADTYLTVTEAHLARVRTCLFAWSSAESGAAALALFEDYCVPEGDDEMSLVIDLFLDKARLESYRGTIRNPFADTKITDTDISILLDGMPDGATKASISSRADVPFEASADELALWAEAYRYHGGINPKRPFGSESVSRDVRKIVDPERKMTKAAFSTYRKQLESRLALLLVFFVQNASLETGDYVWRDASWFTKAELQRDEDEAPELLTEGDWCYRVLGEIWHLHFGYIRTCAPLYELVEAGRISEPYAAMVERYRLWDHYDEPQTDHYEGRLLDHTLSGIGHFPETSGDPEDSLLTLIAARVLNATARFEEAAHLLQQARLSPQTGEKTDIEKVNYIVVAVLERLVADLGSGRVKADELDDILEGNHEAYPEIGWAFYALVDRLGKTDPGLNDVEVQVYEHARAVVAQLKIMRQLAEM